MSAGRSAASHLRLLRAQAPSQRLLHSSTSYASPSVASSSSAAASTSDAAVNTAASSSTRIISSLILSRPPRILREPSSFEKAYHDYNRQLSEALQQPFPKDFYFKKGSAAEKRYEEDQASSPLGFSAIATDASAKKGGKAKDTSAATTPSTPTTSSTEGDAENRPLPRTTEADAKNNLRSLERKLDRTLYLVVKQKSGWTFPAKALADTARENLHDVAPASVTDALGKKMDIWLVSNLPVGVFKGGAAEKTYFLRGHVLAGNAEVNKGKGDVEEFQWLTKEEIEKLLGQSKDSSYWQHVEDLLDP